MTNLNLILQTNNIETQTKKSVLDFSTIIADVIFSVLMMATQDDVDRARKRDHQAQVIQKSFKDDDVADVFCKHMMMMLILPRWEIKNDVSGEG